MTKTKPETLNVKCPECACTWTGDPKGTRIRWSLCPICDVAHTLGQSYADHEASDA